MNEYLASDEVVVLDFETTGLSTDYERIIEVGAAIVKEGEIQSTFSLLCDPGFSIPSFITGLTGISNAMVKGKPSPEDVMEQFYDYIGERPLIAHNASFDTRFLYAEMERIGKIIENPTLCTLLLSRRLMQDADDHKLGTLKRYIGYVEEAGHSDHRALDDVKVTVSLWLYLNKVVREATEGLEIEFATLQQLSRLSKRKIRGRLDELRGVCLTN